MVEHRTASGAKSNVRRFANKVVRTTNMRLAKSNIKQRSCNLFDAFYIFMTSKVVDYRGNGHNFTFHCRWLNVIFLHKAKDDDYCMTTNDEAKQMKSRGIRIAKDREFRLHASIKLIL